MNSNYLPEFTAKRYLVFGIDRYYPMGGMADLIGAYPTYDLAEDAIARYKDRGNNRDEYEITDILAEIYTGDCW